MPDTNIRTASRRSPVAKLRATPTGITAPTTQSSCWRTANGRTCVPARQGHVTLRDRVETRLGDRSAQRRANPRAGPDRRGRGAATRHRRPSRGEQRQGQQRRLGDRVANPRDDPQSDEGADGTDRQSEGEPAQTRVLTSQTEGEEERGEAHGESHERRRASSPHETSTSPSRIERAAGRVRSG